MKLLLKCVSLVTCQKALTLKTSNHDSRPDTYDFGEVVYGIIGERFLAYEIGQRTGWNKRIRRKAAGLRLVLLHLRIDNTIGQIFRRVVDHERTLVPVKEDVSDFMKQSEPELIVSLVPQR